MRLSNPFGRVVFAGFVLFFAGCFREMPPLVSEVKK